MTSPRLAALALAFATASSACVPSEAPEPQRAVADARTGGEITVAITRPGSVDPANAFDPAAELIARTMCDTLLTTDPVTGDLEPGLAASWLVTDEGRQIVLRLRRDVTFTDGEPFTARDVVASLSRAASPEFAGELAHLLQPIAGWDELRGVVETDVARHRRELAGVSAVGEHAVQITLLEPDADVVSVLTHPVTAPVSSTAVAADPEGFSLEPTCVGPYVLSESWSPTADVITLARTEDYRGLVPTATRNGAGWADRIVLRVTGEQPRPTAPTPDDPPTDADHAPAPQVAAPSLRGLDLAAIAPEARDAIDAQPAFTVLDVAGPGIDHVGVPIPVGGDDQARIVRHALSLAIDRRAVAAAVGGRAPATGFLPPTTGPAFRPGACATTPTGADPATARELLADTGAALSSLELVTTDEFRNLVLAEAVADSWRRHLGLAVTIEVVDWATMQRRAASVDGFSDPFRTSWSQHHPGPDGYLDAMAHSSRIGTTNWSRFSDPVVDEALADDARTATDRADLLLELQRVEDRLCEQLPVIPVVREVRTWALRHPAAASARPDGTVLGRTTALPLLRELYARR